MTVGVQNLFGDHIDLLVGIAFGHSSWLLWRWSKHSDECFCMLSYRNDNCHRLLLPTLFFFSYQKSDSMIFYFFLSWLKRIFHRWDYLTGWCRSSQPQPHIESINRGRFQVSFTAFFFFPCLSSAAFHLLKWFVVKLSNLIDADNFMFWLSHSICSYLLLISYANLMYSCKAKKKTYRYADIVSLHQLIVIMNSNWY